MRKTRLLALSSVAAAALAAPAHAGGFYLQEQSVRGVGRAFSGEVADTGVASLWWNPAAIARSGREAAIGLHGILPQGAIRNSGSTITYPGGLTAPIQGPPIAYKPIESAIVPNFAVAMPVGERFAVGFSAGAPFALATKYDHRDFTRYDALTSDLRTIDLQMTGAMQVTDWLDVGVAAHAEYVEATLSNALPNLGPTLPDGGTRLSGDGWDFGWSVGAQARFDRLSLGASYKSRIEHELDGQVAITGLVGPLAAQNGVAQASATFTTPWIATFGARYALTDQLTLNGQVQRIGWSEFDAIRVRRGPGLQVIPQNYKDVTTGGVGLDYALNPALTLRAGVQFDPTPTPDIGRTARVPDADRVIYAVGATASITPSTQIDAGLAYIDVDESRVDHTQVFYPGTPAATTTRVTGRTTDGAVYLLSLGMRTKF